MFGDCLEAGIVEALEEASAEGFAIEGEVLVAFDDAGPAVVLFP